MIAEPQSMTTLAPPESRVQPACTAPETAVLALRSGDHQLYGLHRQSELGNIGAFDKPGDVCPKGCG